MTTPNLKKKVVVAMSGGVDSSVAAALLQRQGYDCVGVFMRLGNDPAEMAAAPNDGPARDELVACSPEKKARPHHQGCCSTADAADARYVAGLLGIPFYALNFEHDFGGIIDYFVREYNRGRTPNPCVRCNEHLKFGKLSRYARAIGADYVATGHYARIGRDVQGQPQLLRAVDESKDQSYVLFGAPPEELARMLLPIGEYPKAQVRQLAASLGLPVHNKPDSQEICFVPDNNYARLLQTKTPDQLSKGPIVDAAGKLVGAHEGHQHFTLGQRRGVGVAFGYPVYVTAIDARSNTVTIGPHEELLHHTLLAREINWLETPPAAPRRCAAKVRYNSKPAAATVQQTDADTLIVRFDEPIAAITPGQAVVCYDGPRVLGGGWIDEVRE